MDTALFINTVNKHSDKLRLLMGKKILLVSNCYSRGLLDDGGLSEKNAVFFKDDDAVALDSWLNADFIHVYPHPVLVDFKKAIGLFRNSSLSGAERIKTAFMMSRINFMGTDGIRGKIATDSDANCVSAFVRDGLFTPALVETASFSFATMLLDNGTLTSGDIFVVGNDGRDIASDLDLNNAMINGFARAQVNVLDIGIVPTALVPFFMLKKECHGGAMLTASHNPSNQNGIKFFCDGKKLLPEGPRGDYAFSAYLYYHCNYTKLPRKNGKVRFHDRTVEDGAQLVLSALPANTGELLRDTTLVLDNANGASADIGLKVLDDLGVCWTTKNEKPTGTNINKHCGVAEIEGVESFGASAYDTHIPFIKEIFDKGRAGNEEKVFGISLDGDGDRGFLLFYEKKSDCVHVLDGDKCGYILAEYFLKKNDPDPKDYWFVSTIESDLMAATSAEKELGLRTRVVSVGDKWIGNFNQGKLLVGLEASGHLIFPVGFINESGMPVSLLSGIGLLTGLLTLVAIREMHLDTEKIIRPFEPGFSKTFYCFFVDKSKFYRNSGVWMNDCDIVAATVAQLKQNNVLGSDTQLLFEDKEDPNVLYISLVNGRGPQGCVFMRNSGTEDKTATYVKGRPEIKAALLEIGRSVQNSNVQLMKNKSRVEYGYETFILKSLSDPNGADMKDIKAALEKEIRIKVNENDLLGVVHGLKKEGRIIVRQVNGTTKISSSLPE